MLFGLLKTLLVIDSFFLILIVLVQQSKGGMGLGSLGGSSQMLFGGSGGQDLLQKITWILGAIFMFGSLILSLMASRTQEPYYPKTHTPQATQRQLPSQEPTSKNTETMPIQSNEKTSAQ